MDKQLRLQMEEELWELDRLGFKKKKNKPRLDKHGRRLFDTQGNYIPPDKRVASGLLSEISKMDDKPRKQWYKKQMKIRAQRISEEMEFGNE